MDVRIASGKFVVILPYFSEEEVDRYLQSADWLRARRSEPLNCDFLLAASPRIASSRRLLEGFQGIGKQVVAFSCPSQVFGYPAGPTAMFWDSMDFIADQYQGPGFSLWFESDMAFTKTDWLERLAQEWFGDGDEPIMMGRYVPEVFKFRWLRQRKKILDPHINGGACYALDFARRLPMEAREGVFDMATYRFAKERGVVKATQQIGFSTTYRVRRDVLSDETCVLHGFMQDKDQFIARCLAPISRWEQQNRIWHPLHEQLELMRRRVSVCFFRKGRRAMLENVLLAQQRVQH